MCDECSIAGTSTAGTSGAFFGISEAGTSEESAGGWWRRHLGHTEGTVARITVARSGCTSGSSGKSGSGGDSSSIASSSLGSSSSGSGTVGGLFC